MTYDKAIAICGASLLAAVGTGAAAFPVRASSARPVVIVRYPEDYVTRYVTYVDLNLASAPGERALD